MEECLSSLPASRLRPIWLASQVRKHTGAGEGEKRNEGEKRLLRPPLTVPDMQDVWDRNTLIHGLVADMQKAGALVANGTLPARHLAHQT